MPQPPRNNFVPLPGDPTPSTTIAPPIIDRRILFVLLAGLLTTAISLAGEYWLTTHADVHIMGWYLDYIIPAGAVLVGLAASSGYAVFSLLLGVRIRRGLLISIVLLMLTAYFAAEYIEFRSHGARYVIDNTNALAADSTGKILPQIHKLGFWEYFHYKAINWTWKKENDRDKESEPLGMWGYAFVLLGIAGFTLSGLIFPTVVGAQSYCEPCRRYMKRRTLTLLPGSMPYKKFSKKEAAEQTEYDKQHQSTWNQATDKTTAMIDAAKHNDAPAFTSQLPTPTHPTKQVEKLPRRINVSLSQCPACASGYLEIKIRSGQGKQLKVTKLCKEKLTPEFVRAINTSIETQPSIST